MDLYRPPRNLNLPSAIEACVGAQMQAILWALNWRVYVPVADLDGVDWLACNPKPEVKYYRIQQKTSFVVERRYLNKDLWIGFPLPCGTVAKGRFGFFLAPHDGKNSLMEFAEERGHLETASWRSRGRYTYAAWRSNAPLATWLCKKKYLIGAD